MNLVYYLSMYSHFQSETERYGRVEIFFFFFVQSEAPSDSPDSSTGRPTLGKACSLELSTLMTRGNAG